MMSGSGCPGPLASSTVVCGKYVVTRTNRCPAVAANLPDDWPARPVRTHGADTRGRLHHDLTGSHPALFAAFGLPECL